MKTLVTALITLSLIGFAGIAEAAWYAKFDGVDGSSAQSQPARAGATATASGTVRAPAPTPEPQAAGADYLLEIDGVKGESKSEPVPAPTPAASQSKIEALPIKQGAQEGTGAAPANSIKSSPSAPAADKGHKNEIEILSNSVNPEPLMPDMSILLGGGGGDEAAGGVNVASGDVNGLTDEQRTNVAEILKQGLMEEGAPVENVSLNFEKVSVTLTHPLKFLGVFPVQASAQADINAAGEVSVRFPWWAFLASGKDTDALASGVQSALTNVLKTKHDTVKNAIGNIR